MEQLEITVTCPGCREKFMQKIEGMRPGSSQDCPACSEVITFTGDDLDSIQKELDSLQREIRRLNQEFEE